MHDCIFCYVCIYLYKHSYTFLWLAYIQNVFIPNICLGTLFIFSSYFTLVVSPSWLVSVFWNNCGHEKSAPTIPSVLLLNPILVLKDENASHSLNQYLRSFSKTYQSFVLNVSQKFSESPHLWLWWLITIVNLTRSKITWQDYGNRSSQMALTCVSYQNI